MSVGGGVLPSKHMILECVGGWSYVWHALAALVPTARHLRPLARDARFVGDPTAAGELAAACPNAATVPGDASAFSSGRSSDLEKKRAATCLLPKLGASEWCLARTAGPANEQSNIFNAHATETACKAI